MRMFLAGIVVMAVLGVGGYFLLNSIQKPADVAFATSNVRVDPQEAPGEHNL
jgi:hypothetical protein